MCFSYDAIEHQAYHFADKISKSSIYRPVQIVVAGNKSFFITPNSLLGTEQNEFHAVKIPLISYVILEDEDGHSYKIEPCENGLKFARGEITYKDYLQLQKSGSWQIIGFSLAFFGGFIALGFGLMKFL